MVTIRKWYMLLGIVPLLFASVTGFAQEKGWKQEWNKVLSAARQEGKVVMAASPHATVRRMLPAAFKKKYGITLEYIGARTSQTAGKLRAERRAKMYTLDVIFGGSSTLANILYAENMLVPFRDKLILPEVLDPSKWKRGELWFNDPGEKYILRLFNTVAANLYMNTDHVNPKEIRTANDLLNPKWKGKIAVLDPRSGSGASTAAVLYHFFGKQYVKKFYIDQKPAMTRNRRQIADWLARGTYPISPNVGRGDVLRFKEEGFPVKIVYGFPDLPARITAGNGMVALLNNAPHPNAARVFLNWVASKEGLEVLSRSYLYPTTRNDVDESFIPPEQLPRPDKKYFDSYGWEWVTRSRIKYGALVREMLKSRR